MATLEEIITNKNKIEAFQSLINFVVVSDEYKDVEKIMSFIFSNKKEFIKFLKDETSVDIKDKISLVYFLNLPSDYITDEMIFETKDYKDVFILKRLADLKIKNKLTIKSLIEISVKYSYSLSFDDSIYEVYSEDPNEPFKITKVEISKSTIKELVNNCDDREFIESLELSFDNKNIMLGFENILILIELSDKTKISKENQKLFYDKIFKRLFSIIMENEFYGHLDDLLCGCTFYYSGVEEFYENELKALINEKLLNDINCLDNIIIFSTKEGILNILNGIEAGLVSLNSYSDTFKIFIKHCSIVLNDYIDIKKVFNYLNNIKNSNMIKNIKNVFYINSMNKLDKEQIEELFNKEIIKNLKSEIDKLEFNSKNELLNDPYKINDLETPKLNILYRMTGSKILNILLNNKILNDLLL